MFMLAHVSSSFRSMLIAEANRDSKRWGLFGLAGLFVAAQGLLRIASEQVARPQHCARRSVNLGETLKSTQTSDCPRSGLVKATHKILMLQRGALLVGGPPCSSWVFINAGTHGRSRWEPNGFTKKRYVQMANRRAAQL